MVQISNAGNGFGDEGGKTVHKIAPVNGSYADVVYEVLQKQRRRSYPYEHGLFRYDSGLCGLCPQHPSDPLPDQAGMGLRVLTSGYPAADIPDEWRRLGVPNPAERPAG